MIQLLSEYIRIDSLARKAPDDMVVPSEEIGEGNADAKLEDLKAAVRARAGGPADGSLPAGFKLGG
jgi:hypothetical protein